MSQYISPNIVINLDQEGPRSTKNGTGKPVYKSSKGGTLQKICSSSQKKTANIPQRSPLFEAINVLTNRISNKNKCLQNRKQYCKSLNPSNVNNSKHVDNLIYIDLTIDDNDEVIQKDRNQLHCQDKAAAADKYTIPESRIITSSNNGKKAEIFYCDKMSSIKIIPTIVSPLDGTLENTLNSQETITNVIVPEVLTEEEILQEEYYNSLNNTTEDFQTISGSSENTSFREKKPKSKHDGLDKVLKNFAKDTPEIGNKSEFSNFKNGENLITNDINKIDPNTSGLEITSLLDSIDADEIVEALKICTSEKECTQQPSHKSNNTITDHTAALFKEKIGLEKNKSKIEVSHEKAFDQQTFTAKDKNIVIGIEIIYDSKKSMVKIQNVELSRKSTPSSSENNIKKIVTDCKRKNQKVSNNANSNNKPETIGWNMQDKAHLTEDDSLLTAKNSGNKLSISMNTNKNFQVENNLSGAILKTKVCEHGEMAIETNLNCQHPGPVTENQIVKAVAKEKIYSNSQYKELVNYTDNIPKINLSNAVENESMASLPISTKKAVVDSTSSPKKIDNANENFPRREKSLCGNQSLYSKDLNKNKQNICSRSSKSSFLVKTNSVNKVSRFKKSATNNLLPKNIKDKKNKVFTPNLTKQENGENILLPESKKLLLKQKKIKGKQSHETYRPKHGSILSTHSNKKSMITNNNTTTRLISPAAGNKNAKSVVQDANIKYKYGAVINSKCVLKNYVIPKIKMCKSPNKCEILQVSQKKYSINSKIISDNTKRIKNKCTKVIINETKGLMRIKRINKSEDHKETNAKKINASDTSNKQIDKKYYGKHTTMTDHENDTILSGIEVTNIESNSLSRKEDYDELSLIKEVVSKIILDQQTQHKTLKTAQEEISEANQTFLATSTHDNSFCLNTEIEQTIDESKSPETNCEPSHIQNKVQTILSDTTNMNDIDIQPQTDLLGNICTLSDAKNKNIDILCTVNKQENYGIMPRDITKTDSITLEDRSIQAKYKDGLINGVIDIKNSLKSQDKKHGENNNKSKTFIKYNTRVKLELKNTHTYGKRKPIENITNDEYDFETKKTKVDSKESDCKEHKDIKNIDPKNEENSMDIDKEYIMEWISSNQTLAGRYSINCGLHRGHNSWILRTKDIDNKDALTAVKILPKKTVSEKPDHIKILLKLAEADIIGNFHCIHALKIFQHNNYLCIAMDFYPKNLSQALKLNGAGFHIDKVRDLSCQLLKALILLRINEIVHTDIQPCHILVNEEVNKLKLSGFDNAVFWQKPKIPKNIITLNYQAPEVLLGKSVGYAADIWSAACIMFEIASQQVLFEGASAHQILEKAIQLKGPISEKLLKKGWLFPQLKQNGQRPNIQAKLFQAYKSPTVDSTKRRAEDHKIKLFSDLLDRLLTLDCADRKPVELAYVHPFIYE